MITLIAAVGKNGELGKKNGLIWNIPSDLKFFREQTLNHKVIMGYNTYLSIGKPLPKRENIVLCHDIKLVNEKGIKVYDDISKLIDEEIKDEEVFIIGGASLYKYFYPLANKMYLTLIDDEDKEADVYFPRIDESLWNKEIINNSFENNVNFAHILYRRKNNE